MDAAPGAAGGVSAIQLCGPSLLTTGPDDACGADQGTSCRDLATARDDCRAGKWLEESPLDGSQGTCVRARCPFDDKMHDEELYCRNAAVDGVMHGRSDSLAAGEEAIIKQFLALPFHDQP